MRVLNLVLTTVVVSSLLLVTARAEPVKIRIGWIVPVTDIVSIIFAKKGIATENGGSYVLEPVHFQGSSQEITALASGDLQIGLLGFSSFPLAVENAGMKDLRIIADEMQDGAHGYYSNEFLVRADSPIHSVKDLKGKVVATNAIGSGLDVAMEAMLAKEGLGGKNAVTVIEAPIPTMKSMLLERKVELIPGVPPFSYQPQLAEHARTLFTEKDAMGTSELAFLVARKPFLSRDHRAVVDFLADYLRAVRWYTNPAHHAEAVAIAAKFSKLPPAVFKDWLFTKRDDYRGPDGLPDLAALQSNVDLQQKLGFIKRTMNVRAYADLGLIKEAAKRLN